MAPQEVILSEIKLPCDMNLKIDTEQICKITGAEELWDCILGLTLKGELFLRKEVPSYGNIEKEDFQRQWLLVINQTQWEWDMRLLVTSTRKSHLGRCIPVTETQRPGRPQWHKPFRPYNHDPLFYCLFNWNLISWFSPQFAYWEKYIGQININVNKVHLLVTVFIMNLLLLWLM
jgi:hypothetical protein